MTKNFESEIRILIDNMATFQKKLEKFNAKIIHQYQFNDHIYIPKRPTSNWNPNQKTMRIREHVLPDEFVQVLFTENQVIAGKTFQFKRSKYPVGKLPLFKGDLKTAQQLLQSWDFQYIFMVEKKSGKLFEVLQPQKFVIAVEEINHLGYSAEIEVWGEDIETVENSFLKILSLLEIPLENVKSNSLPYMVADHLNYKNLFNI